MIALLKVSLSRQYGASLKMLHNAVEQCDAECWVKPVAAFPFWHVAYHVLFFTDLYLSLRDSEFRTTEFHRENYHVFGQQSWPPYAKVTADLPYEKAVLLRYGCEVRKKAARVIAGEDESSLSGASGFHWLAFPRLELHLYNIRHVQHHAAQLQAALLRAGGDVLPWVGSEAVL